MALKLVLVFFVVMSANIFTSSTARNLGVSDEKQIVVPPFIGGDIGIDIGEGGGGANGGLIGIDIDGGGNGGVGGGIGIDIGGGNGGFGIGIGGIP
ncbi:glycine-rich protein 5-like [Salvia hispanica]|uniref:glycine-rich protein 5-like n=1 Tax=Salvia hispanica TaxID=49212 RepID=UPI00200992A2|nr:glycine-rich protein 5-like [Salvia hispanica]